MFDVMIQIARELRASVGLESFRGLLSQGLAQAGFDEFIFMPAPDRSPLLQLRPEGTALLDRYAGAGFMRVDPIVSEVRRSGRPVAWDAWKRYSASERQPQRQLWDCVLSLGYRTGVSVPVHCPQGAFGNLACISSSRQPLTALRERSDWVTVLATLAANVYHEQFGDPEVEPPELTERELDCLAWTARGKTAWETGKILRISARTVNFHVQNAMHKLNATTKHQAAYRAYRLGLLVD
jgi:LuxR family transcriptional regulator, activator of conjugal transfer of Ti plasmids